jgi:hypothetical protein
MDDIDLSAWLGKPPESIQTAAQHDAGSEARPAETDSLASGPSFSQKNGELSSSNDLDDTGDILHDDGNADNINGGVPLRSYMENTLDTEDESENETSSVGLVQSNFYVNVPKMSDADKETFEYLPGHFSVEKVLYQRRKDMRYVVRVESGEESIVSWLPGMNTVSFVSRTQFESSVICLEGCVAFDFFIASLRSILPNSISPQRFLLHPRTREYLS